MVSWYVQVLLFVTLHTIDTTTGSASTVVNRNAYPELMAAAPPPIDTVARRHAGPGQCSVVQVGALAQCTYSLALPESPEPLSKPPKRADTRSGVDYLTVLSVWTAWRGKQRRGLSLSSSAGVSHWKRTLTERTPILPVPMTDGRRGNK